jgi:GT2 family glycosyltransferase
MPSFVNIAMVTYNRLEFTKTAIESILQKTHYPFYLTIVDNNSVDGTQDYLKNLYNKKFIKNLILLDKNVGVAPAANLAWQMEDVDYYMKYDNDMQMLKDNWLNDMVVAMNTIPKLGMLGYNVEPYNFHISEENGIKLRRRECIGGAISLIPRKVWEDIGYWNEEYGAYGEEDVDYGLRVNASGHFCAYMEDNEMVLHLQSPRENDDKVYRKWKDDCRSNNTDKFNANTQKYIHGKDIKKEFKTLLKNFDNKIYRGE